VTQPRLSSLLPLAAAWLLCMPVYAQALDQRALCGEPIRPPPRPFTEPGEPGTLNIRADDADMDMDGVSILRGEVQVQRDTQQIEADTVIYDAPNEAIDASGLVRFWDEGLYLSGTHAEYELGPNVGWVDNVHYRFEDKQGRGNARRGDLNTTTEVLNLEQADYTTCPPGATDWLLRASSLKLDKRANVGTARNVRLRFKNVPVFYSPYLRFPLSDERKTGFLAPTVGTSGETGTELLVPFYLNIAPEQDATVALRSMSKRGVMLMGEYRYLLRSGGGLAEVEYLPDDDEFGEDRALYHFRHNQQFNPRWSTHIDVSHASDKQYFEDLGTRLSVSATRFLERNAGLTYQGDNWSAMGRVQTHQTVDDTIDKVDQPYHRVPQLLLSTDLPERNRTLSLQGHTEAVRFDKSVGVQGNRFDINPGVTLPLRTPGTFLVPKLSLRYTAYDLNRTEPDDPDNPSRTIPTFSLDSGLFFEKSFRIGGHSYLHTIEPRIFYLYVPRKNQSDLPVFDTGEYTFGFAQLFRENRFSGADRVGDANQVTLALTTRLLDEDTGRERLRLSLGQIQYIRDQKVTLPDTKPNTDNASDIIADLAAEITQSWGIRSELHWDTGAVRSNRGTVSLRYKPDSRRVLNLAYRFVRDTTSLVDPQSVSQTDFSLAWPLTRHWGVVGRWNYDVSEDRTLETLAGFEYNSCCWALRALARRFLNSSDGSHNDEFFVQLELKGLGGFGRSAAEVLREEIPGWENNF